MTRPKKKPYYDAEKIMKDLMLAVAESYEETGELKLTAAEFALSSIKIRKLLITAQEKGLLLKYIQMKYMKKSILYMPQGSLWRQFRRLQD